MNKAFWYVYGYITYSYNIIHIFFSNSDCSLTGYKVVHIAGQTINIHQLALVKTSKGKVRIVLKCDHKGDDSLLNKSCSSHETTHRREACMCSQFDLAFQHKDMVSVWATAHLKERPYAYSLMMTHA